MNYRIRYFPLPGGKWAVVASSHTLIPSERIKILNGGSRIYLITIPELNNMLMGSWEGFGISHFPEWANPYTAQIEATINGTPAVKQTFSAMKTLKKLSNLGEATIEAILK